MTQNEIIEMVRDAGFEDFDRWCKHYPQETQRWCQRMETFAKLVAAKQREVSATFIEELDERGFKELAALIRKKGLTND
jgi:hypothetical protein